MIEKIPYLKTSGSRPWNCCRCSSSTRRTVRAGLQLLGILAGLVLRTACRLQFAARTPSARSTSSGHRQGAAPRRDRGDPRRRLQPHRRGRRSGPTLSFRGLDNNIYYMLDEDRARYANYTGCRQHPERQSSGRAPPDPRLPAVLGRRDARRWVPLRPCLDPRARRDGSPARNPPVLWDIETDPVLAGTKLIAEAWDAAGLYQVGSFIGDAGGNGTAGSATTCAASSRATGARCGCSRNACSAAQTSIGYPRTGARPNVNFVTCHDGFTLNDLVSYNDKHNEANGEGNRDGWTITCPGTAGSRVRPAIPRSRHYAAARSRISWLFC